MKKKIRVIVVCIILSMTVICEARILFYNAGVSITVRQPTSQSLSCISLSTTYPGWTRVGASPYLNLLDSVNYIKGTSEQYIGWFDFANTTLSGTSFVVNISFYCWDTDNNGRIFVFVDYTGGTGTSVGTVGQHTVKRNDTINLGTHTLLEVNKLRVRLYSRYTSSTLPVYADYAVVKVKIV